MFLTKKNYLQKLIERWYWLWVGALTVILIVIAQLIEVPSVIVGQTPFLDFDAYYLMTQEIGAGVSPYAVSTMQTAGPPLVIVPYVLTRGLSLEEARGSMTLLSVGASFLASWLLAVHIAPRRRLLTALILMVGLWVTFPARFTLMMGQSNLLIMLFATVVLTRKGWWQALALSAMIILKTNYSLVWLFLWRKPKVLIGSIIAVCVVMCAGFTFIPPSAYQQYFTTRFMGFLQVASPPTGMDYYNQSIQSTLARVDVSAAYPLIAIGLFMLMIVVAWKVTDLAFGIVFSVLLSPIIWQHYLIVLYPVLILFAWKIRGKPMMLLGSCISYLLMMTNWHGLHATDPNLITGLIGSHQLVGVILLLVLMLWQEFRADIHRCIAQCRTPRHLIQSARKPV